MVDVGRREEGLRRHKVGLFGGLSDKNNVWGQNSPKHDFWGPEWAFYAKFAKFSNRDISKSTH